jgi:O-antigen/teichoic acid export membrane protein
MVAALLMAAAMFLFADRLAQLTNPQHVEEATAYLRVLAVFIPFAGLENVGLAATRGLGTMRVNALVEQIARPMIQLVLVAVVLATSATGLVGWSWGLAYVPAAFVAWIWWTRLRPTPSPTAAPEAGRSAEFWRFSGPRALTSVIQIVMQRFDIVLVGALSGPVDAAIYAAATRFVVAGQMGNNAISMATQPRLAESIAAKDNGATNHIYQVSTSWLMVITWPMFFLFIVFGEPLMQLFGDGYSAGRSVLWLVSVSMLIGTGCGMVDMVLTMAGRTTWNLANAALALIVMLGLDLLLIPSHGIVGAAIGWGAAILVRNLAALTQVGVSLRLHPLGRATATAALLTTVCFLIVGYAARLVVGASWSGSICSVGLGLPLYVLGLYLGRGPLNLAALRAIRSGGIRRRQRRLD